MIILIAGDTHTGKTLLAPKLMEKLHYPYLSIDHLKMGLIRSGLCELSALSSDEELTHYLWPIVREIVKTNIENSQNIIIEGCYIPFGWEMDFSKDELQYISYVCLIFSQNYIEHHFEDIMRNENIIEKRQVTDLFRKDLEKSNRRNLEQCRARNYPYILIDDHYPNDIKKGLVNVKL